MTTLISSVQDSLPNIQKYPLRHEMDFYGFSNMISTKLGLEYTPLPCVSSWKHGWTPAPLIKYPLQISHWGTQKNHHVVQTKWQKDFLKSHGFRNVTAAGAPFCYVSETATSKIPNSLLIVPVHTLSNLPVEEDFELFFEEAQKIRKNFSTAVVCLHQESVTESILSVLKKFNFQYVLGASAHDANSLVRIQKLFCQFDSLITNQIGSHVPYFNLHGGKTSIVGPYHILSSEYLEKHEWYRKNPHLIEAAKLHTEENIRTYFPFLFTKIEDQKCYKEWAKEELGADLILPIQKVRELVGWTTWGKAKRLSTNPKDCLKNFLNRDMNPIVR